MANSSFFIVGRHAVIEALNNPKRKVLRIFLTEESKKTIHRSSPKVNLIKNLKIFFKTKKELDKFSRNDGIQHQGFVAEVEHLDKSRKICFVATSSSYNFLKEAVKFKKIVFCELPKTSTGKIQKFELRKKAKELN